MDQCKSIARQAAHRVAREQPSCKLLVLPTRRGTYLEQLSFLAGARAFSTEAIGRTLQMRNPVSSAKSPAKLVFKPARCLGTPDPETTALEQSSVTKRRLPWSPLHGVVTTPACNTTEIRSFFDRCASTGSPEQHGHAQRLLEYRLALVRSLARPRPTDVVLDLGCGNGHHLLALRHEIARGVGVDISPGMIELAQARLRSSPGRAKLAFKVDNAEELKGIADQSIDLVICIGAFEHMLDKQAVLASIHRVLKFGGRFFCLTLNADYVWYRTMAPLFRIATKHLSSDRMLTGDEFSALLDAAGFRGSRCATWTFIPKGDMSAIVASLLTVLDVVGRHTRFDSFRGGLSLCAWKEAKLS